MLRPELVELSNQYNVNKYALTVNVLLKDKFNLYRLDADTQRQEISQITNKMLTKLGYKYPVSLELPLYTAYKVFNVVKIFLDNILYAVLFFLTILSFMLIYSLMLGVLFNSLK